MGQAPVVGPPVVFKRTALMSKLLYMIFILCSLIMNSCVNNITGDLTVVVKSDNTESLIVLLSRNKEHVHMNFIDDYICTYKYKNLQFGNYLISIYPNKESISQECIMYKNVTLKSPNKIVKIIVPSKTVDLLINFETDNLPDRMKSLVAAKINKVNSSGVDEIYRQWVLLQVTKKGFRGKMFYASKGMYKLTITGPEIINTCSHERKKLIICTKEFTIDEKILTKGRIQIEYGKNDMNEEYLKMEKNGFFYTQEE